MKNSFDKTGIVLLSGGLDSYISLDMALSFCDVVLALNFNYGQKAFEDENHAASQIASKYNIKLETIEVPFLKSITSNALIDEDNKNFDDFKSVWVPNRNGLFLNIAACYADRMNIDYIIFGANKEEALEFPDNTKNFIVKINDAFKYSTLKRVEVIAPCIGLDKVDMINYLIDNKLPLNIIKSCYNASSGNKKHCGNCKSCRLLFGAIKKSKNPELIKEII